MMPRISVSLPDELMARLEPVKDRINVSQECREALERRIASFERLAEQQNGDIDMPELVERLREERTLVEGRFEQLARTNAARWLSTAGYSEFKLVVDGRAAVDVETYRLPKAAFKQMKKDVEEARLGSNGVHATAYKTAWLDYVGSIWSEVVDQVEGPETAAVSVQEDASE